MCEERAVGDVLPEGDPVHLLVPVDDGTVGTEGDHLVPERGRRHRLGDADHQRRVQGDGQAGQRTLFGIVGQRLVEGDHVLGPQHQRRGVGPLVGEQPVGGGHRGVEHGGRVDLGLPEAPYPATLHGRCGHPPDHRSAVGRVVGNGCGARQGHECHGAGDGQRPEADHGTPPDGRPVGLRVEPVELDHPAVAAHRPDTGEAERARRHPARVDGGGQPQRAAQPCHAEHGPAGLPEEHAADGEAAEGPRLADGLGQGEGRREGQGTGHHRPPWHRQARHPHEQRLGEDEHDRAGQGEGPGEHAPRHVAAEAGQPPGPEPGPWPEPAEPPPQQAGGRERQGPEAPRGERQCEPDPGRHRRQRHGAPTRGDPVRVGA